MSTHRVPAVTVPNRLQVSATLRDSQGFALFASKPHTEAADDGRGGLADPLSFLTNAHQNARRATGSQAGVGGGGGVSGDRGAGGEGTDNERALAASLGLALPPSSLRWPLHGFLRLVTCRVHGMRICSSLVSYAACHTPVLAFFAIRASRLLPFFSPSSGLSSSTRCNGSRHRVVPRR